MTDKCSLWQSELENDPDKSFLLQGIKEGFRITDGDCQFKEAEMNNYRSATADEFSDKVQDQILTEIKEGHYVYSDKKPTIVSALGAIPKPNSDKVRLIHDCSRPLNLGLNHYATTESVQYQTIDYAVQMMKPGCYFSKVDLASAYRSVKIHPNDYEATGLKWLFNDHKKPTYFYDTRLPFGASRSPSIFTRLTQAVCRMMKRRGFQTIICYLDDFLIITDSYEEALEALNTLLHLIRTLGFKINWSKVEGPAQSIKFLGILLDSMSMTLELPSDKMAELRTLLLQYEGRTRASRRQLQSLAGKLNWACQVIFGGRTFLRRVLDTCNTLKQATHKVKLTAEFHKDIQWWLQCMQLFNGKSACLSNHPIADVETDACSAGGGIFFRGSWHYTHWATDWPAASQLHINYKETLCVILAARAWAPLWKDHMVTIFTDSTVCRALINKGTSRHLLIMESLRELFWLSVQYNFHIRAVHVRGQDNTVADAISRITAPNGLVTLSSVLGYSINPWGLTKFLSMLPYSMFQQTFYALFKQVQKLQNWRNSWMLRLIYTEPILSQLLQRKHTALTKSVT